MEHPLVSVVVCVYNEAGNSGPLIAQIDAALHSLNYEIIYVNDGSTDATLTELLALKNRRLTVVDLRKNYGQSAALAAGIDLATGQFIATLDGDQQNDPLDIRPMLELAEAQELDMVMGIRRDRQDNALLRTGPSWLANVLIRHTLGLPIRDNGCALKVFRAETAKSLGLYGELHRFSAVLAHLGGARMAQLPVRHHPRRIGQSKYGLARTGRVLSDLILLLFMQQYGRRPMHLFGGLGLLLLPTGVLLGVFAGLARPGGWLAGCLLGSVWLLAGVQFLAFGLVLELQLRTYHESQGKKTYAVRRVYRYAPATNTQ